MPAVGSALVNTEGTMKKKKLGEVLRDRGKNPPEDPLPAIAEEQGKVIHLGELMLERGLVDKDDLAAALEEVSNVPYLDCSAVEPDPEAIKLVQRATAERCCALPIRIEQGRMVVAIAAPQDLALLDQLRFTTGMEISPRLAFRAEVHKAIAKFYAGDEGLPASKVIPRNHENVRMEEIEFFSTS